jgi:L-seryl-tRNA(Ser) seleniumtransferase
VTGGARLRDLPSVERLAQRPELAPWLSAPSTVRRACRDVLDAERRARSEGTVAGADEAALADAAAAWLRTRLEPGPRRVINATGVVVHTNLGRAPLGAAARAAVARVARGYCDLEVDISSGRRGSRQDHVVPLLTTLCDAEDALVVTNNAAAVLLALTALARGGEVLVSRGEAVEIGGGFRIPEVMRMSGARMVDVGTTNRTRASDYAAAVTPRTRAIVRVHPSNFAIVGFTERPSTAEVAAVAQAHGLPLIEDAGSGALAEDAVLGDEPVLQRCLRDGADLVTASADKLAGGPQAGLIAGRAALVGRLRRHPLMRAVRPDKLVVAALAATLAEWLRGAAVDEVPVAAMLARDPAALRRDADAWASRLRADGVPADVATATSQPGGGSLPGHGLPTTCLVLPGPTGRLVAALRAQAPAVVARAEAGKVWLDPRTVAGDEVDELLQAVRAAWESVHGTSAPR